MSMNKLRLGGQNRPTHRCYSCNSNKHLIKNCPQPKRYDLQDKCLPMLGYLFRLELEDYGADYGADCIVDIEATLNL